MFKESHRLDRAGRLGLALVLGIACGGCASDRHRPFSTPDAPYVVQRPTYAIPGTRPLYLSGYAGANYRPPLRNFP
jgi:hypothetical protein